MNVGYTPILPHPGAFTFEIHRLKGKSSHWKGCLKVDERVKFCECSMFFYHSPSCFQLLGYLDLHGRNYFLKMKGNTVLFCIFQFQCRLPGA